MYRLQEHEQSAIFLICLQVTGASVKRQQLGGEVQVSKEAKRTSLDTWGAHQRTAYQKCCEVRPLRVCVVCCFLLGHGFGGVGRGCQTRVVLIRPVIQRYAMSSIFGAWVSNACCADAGLNSQICYVF